MIELDGNEYRRDDKEGEWGIAIVQSSIDDLRVSPVLSTALDEIERLRAIVKRLTEDMGTINDKLASVILTIPEKDRSNVFIETIDAANRIAFTAWKESVDAVREAAEKARA